MAWFAAHVVLILETDPASTGPVLVMENVYLIEAESEDSAQLKAELRGRADCGNDSGTLTHEGKPAAWVYGGIRKIISPVRNVENLMQFPDEPVDIVEDGTEVTYSRFTVPNREALNVLVSGGAVSVSYEE